jgi:uroporphyrinogen-III synthase
MEKGGTKPLNGSIGPQTSETMRKVGLSVDFEAATPGIDALVTALIRSLS